jgi:hypothetical protein
LLLRKQSRANRKNFTLAVCVQALACVYFEDEPGRRSAAKLLSNDEAAADRGEYR